VHVLFGDKLYPVSQKHVAASCSLTKQPLAKEQFRSSHGPVVMSDTKKYTHDTIHETRQDN